ncbi:arsenate reductase ArsC [Celerinatantimonas diazotrophica]|uniref:Arsenate reductase n=1 Tax=Celerinatantimonas diazotrophica TaxID=412034 RepID=A0A4R1JA00_9GAMM|nr:arsenate reductase ArsC [Celerinatantimonas diazotrophica]TCK47428.1 arsenate reductase [Celerinatantimonas diazotrophica]CAG9294954.1 Arsenate reductase [Celerinatantimonas diazotrophica]
MKILYICTHNRCRSILSEAITHYYGGDLLEAKSAGSQPAGRVHPLSVKYLQQVGIPTDNLQSQSWDDMSSFAPDVVITVCDHAAQESCPVWFGNALQVHWGLTDPSKLEGDETIIEEAFLQTIQTIQERVTVLKQIAMLNQANWQDALQRCGARIKS